VICAPWNPALLANCDWLKPATPVNCALLNLA
jgi:hypothetical protein